MTGPSMAEVIAGWAPEPAVTTDTITAGPALALAGLFDTEPAVTGPGDPIPPLWHWLYFLDRPAQHELGPDGHPAAGRFMPPVPQRRRMFAGGRVSYQVPQRRLGAGRSGGSRKAGGPDRSRASSGARAAASRAVSGGRFHFSCTSLSTEVWSRTSVQT